MVGAVKPFRDAYGDRDAFASESRPPITTRFVPILRSVSGYSGDRLRTDALAGLTVAALALPSAMAYAELAGAPISAGLYALLLPVLAYAAFGSSIRVVVGPEGAVALLVATAIGPLAASGSAEYAALTAMLAVMADWSSSRPGSCVSAGSPTTSPRPCSSATSRVSRCS